MKLSIEATVAGAVAVAFAVLSMAVIAQEQSERGTAAISNPALSQVSSRGFNSSLSGSHGGSADNEVLGLY
jgi:hypothetical protein